MSDNKPFTTMPFGKYEGDNIVSLALDKEGRKYLEWCLKNLTFKGNGLKQAIEDALAGKMPAEEAREPGDDVGPEYDSDGSPEWVAAIARLNKFPAEVLAFEKQFAPGKVQRIAFINGLCSVLELVSTGEIPGTGEIDF